jgi:hypothetical protein
MEETNPTLALGSIDFLILLTAVDTKIAEFIEVPY